jgi:serine/threonine protein kinase
MNPQTIQHPRPIDLAGFALQQLDPAQMATIKDHLTQCPYCKYFIDSSPREALLAILSGANKSETPTKALEHTASGNQTPTATYDPKKDQIPPVLEKHSRYQILRKLGEGGMGVVYQARHKMMNRDVAIKVIHRNFVNHPDTIERFQREITAVAKLSHPNITAAYDAEQADDLQMLVMEYIDGIDLAKYLNSQGPLPVSHACHFARQAALGLQHAFDRGMIHRDIKPQNLMLLPNGTVKILDFGLARFASEKGFKGDLTRETDLMGTPYYMAPEQASNPKSVDIRADIYSLGCTLYHLLAGKPPFEGSSFVELLWLHQERVPESLRSVRSDCPEALAKIVAKSLEKDPAKRQQTPSQLAAELFPFIQFKGKGTPRKDPPKPGSSPKDKQGNTPAEVGIEEIDFDIKPKPKPVKKIIKENPVVQVQTTSPLPDWIEANPLPQPSSGLQAPPDLFEGKSGSKVDRRTPGPWESNPLTTNEPPQQWGQPNSPNQSPINTVGRDIKAQEDRATYGLILILVLVGIIGLGALYFVITNSRSSERKKTETSLPETICLLSRLELMS